MIESLVRCFAVRAMGLGVSAYAGLALFGGRAGLAAAGDAPACAACHGAAGAGGGAVPRLAGLPSGYIEAQLRAFKAGTRGDAAMATVAATLDNAAIVELAAAYAALPPPAARVDAGNAALIARGERLALRGDWDKGLPPCASCHGRRGLGVGAAFPPLAGQPAAYVAKAITAWKSGARHADPLGLMRSVAGHMDDDAVAATAAYYETLPSSLPKTEREP